MTKIDKFKKAFGDIVEIGQENADLTPQVKNWCKHLIVEGYASGMIAEMKGFNNNVSLTCPHAAYPCKWYRISSVAEEFIERNCLNCSWHETLREPNYGQVILAKLKKKNEEKSSNEQLKITLSEKVRQEVNAIISAGTKRANSTEVSILRMVSKLAEGSNRSLIAAKLSAAAELDPTFFSDASLDVLSMFFEDENVGNDCINAAVSAMAGRFYFPVKVFDLAKAQLATSPHFDHLTKILQFYIKGENIDENTSTINTLINRLWYKRFIGEPIEPVRNFQNAEIFLVSLGKEAPGALAEILKKHLSINEKNKRININLLLQKLITYLPTLLAGLTKEIILSLELVDDEYEQSADQLTINTLAVITKRFPTKTIELLKKEKNKLSIEAQEILIKLNIQLIADRAFADRHLMITQTLVEELVVNVLGKSVSENIRKETTHQLSYFVRDRPELFQNYFDGFLGYLSEIVEEEALFKYYKKELEDKRPREIATFNYLVGKRFLEIKEIEQNIYIKYSEINKIIGHLCDASPEQNLPKIFSIITEIDSVKYEKYKQELISIVTDYGRDPFTISKFIPQLYRHLLDSHSINIRYSALQYFDLLIDRFPLLVTSSLWNLFDVFIKDNDVAIKGMSLTVLGTIARKIPEKICAEYIQIHQEALYNPKVFIHSRAIVVADDLHHFMDKDQQYRATILLLQLADVYANDSETIFSSIIDQLLFFSEDQQNFVYRIAEKYIFPKTKVDDYYRALEYIKKLEQLTKKYPNVSALWLKSALSFLIKFPYDGGAQDDRSDLYFTMYHLNYNNIVDQSLQFRELITLPRHASQTHFDIAHILDVFGYFEQYKLIDEVVTILKIQYPPVEANKFLLRLVEFWSLLAKGEITYDLNEKSIFLKTAENVF